MSRANSCREYSLDCPGSSVNRAYTSTSLTTAPSVGRPRPRAGELLPQRPQGLVGRPDRRAQVAQVTDLGRATETLERGRDRGRGPQDALGVLLGLRERPLQARCLTVLHRWQCPRLDE